MLGGEFDGLEDWTEREGYAILIARALAARIKEGATMPPDGSEVEVEVESTFKFSWPHGGGKESTVTTARFLIGLKPSLLDIARRLADGKGAPSAADDPGPGPDEPDEPDEDQGG